MLEFYPMPTNLNHSNVSLYPHHGLSRFLDNRSAVGATPSAHHRMQELNNNNNNNICGQQIAMSPAHSACSSNGSNSNSSPSSVSASLTASLSTAPTTTTTTTPPIAITTSGSSGPTSAFTACSLTALHSSIPPTPQAACEPSTAAASVVASSSVALSSSKLSPDCSGRTEVGHIKCERNYEICEGCGQKIHDRYLMNVGDASWHEHCLSCCYCGIQLHHTCYVRNAKIYCKLDYERLFSVKCATCCHPVLPQEMVMRPIPNYIFHLNCFVCFACRLPLQKGEQFMMRDGQVFCYRHDLEKELFLAAAQHCGFVGLDDDDLLRPRDGRRGPKRPRTILTSQQRKQFKASFDQSPKPCRKVRENLAKDTGLSVRVVQVWFQNQRAKMKKIQRKAKIGASTANSGTGNSRNCEDKESKEKDEKSVKQESRTSSENGYLSLDNTFASQPLNPNLPFSPDEYPANSNDSFCSSDLSLDGSNFDQLDEDADSLSLNNLELQSTGSSSHHHHHHSNPHDILANLNTSLINPIDKLYLMQNSYFNSEP